jgi:hypothetical protein
MTSPWLRDEPAVDYKSLTMQELLRLEAEHVNDEAGHCAAHEVCTRLRAEGLRVGIQP